MSKHQGGTEGNLNTKTKFSLKRALYLIVLTLGMHVYKCMFLLDSLYTEFGGKVSLTDSLLR